jgi:signal peptidase
MKLMRGHIFETAALILVPCIGIAIGYAGASAYYSNLRVYSISSGSMLPLFPIGTLVIVKPEKEYHTGDIVTFSLAQIGGGQTLITHRIYGISQADGYEAISTKGDHNVSPDIGFIRPSAIKGKVKWSIATFGYLYGIIQTRLGLSLLVVAPASILIYEQLKAIAAGLARKKSLAKGQKQ